MILLLDADRMVRHQANCHWCRGWVLHLRRYLPAKRVIEHVTDGVHKCLVCRIQHRHTLSLADKTC